MPFLNLDLDYEDHPKTRRLVGLLGRGSEMVPIRLWSYCGKYHCENGELTGYSAQEIEAIVKWWGKEGDAVEALLKVGFLDKTKKGFMVHSWEEMQGHIHALKVQAKRAAVSRWAKMRDAPGMPPASPRHAAVPDQPDQTLPAFPDRKEKKEGTAPTPPLRPKKPKEKAEKPLWAEFTGYVLDSMSRHKGMKYLPKPGDFKILERVYGYTPEQGMAMWDLFWERGKGWTDFAGRQGHSFECWERCLAQILDDPSLKDRTRKHAARFGIGADQIMSGVGGFLNKIGD